MIRTGIAAGLLLALGAGTATAQHSERVVQAQAAKFSVPLCNLRGTKASDNGQKALKKAIEEKDAAKRAASYQEAHGLLREAVTSDPGNAAGWYFLGRYYLYQGDLRGLDSAWTKAVDLNPGCEIDINTNRQNTWAMLANAGIEFLRVDQTDSAMALFREANTVFRGLPHVLLQTGGIYATMGQDDSAAVYLAEAARVAAEDTSYVEERNSAQLNLAIVQQRMEKHTDAIASLKTYLGWNPGDNEATRSLAMAYRGAGMTDSATAVEERLLAAFSAMNVDSLSNSDLMAVGVGYFNNERYDQAAKIFATVVERNPFSRDGLYNLANAYFALKNFQMLAATSQQLLELDPMSADALQLLGQAQREMKQQDAMLKTAERLIGLPFSLDIAAFQLGATNARLIATATGREAMDARGNIIAGAPITLVFEFLTDNGRVVDVEEVTVPKLQAGAAHEIRLDASGENIRGWRYKPKG